MRQFTKNLVKFLKAEDGPTAVEYAVMLALIIVVCIGAVTDSRQQCQEHVHVGRHEHRRHRQLSLCLVQARKPSRPKLGRAFLVFRPISGTAISTAARCSKVELGLLRYRRRSRTHGHRTRPAPELSRPMISVSTATSFASGASALHRPRE